MGSGKGRVLLCASDFPFQRLIGVEYDERLHTVAQRNAEIYRSAKQRCHNFEWILGKAEEFALPTENATGNYVKVVQRLPVRIRFKPGQQGLDRLRPGMSVVPKVWLK